MLELTLWLPDLVRPRVEPPADRQKRAAVVRVRVVEEAPSHEIAEDDGGENGDARVAVPYRVEAGLACALASLTALGRHTGTWSRCAKIKLPPPGRRV